MAAAVGVCSVKHFIEAVVDHLCTRSPIMEWNVSQVQRRLAGGGNERRKDMSRGKMEVNRGKMEA